jgi:hypothetical protein
MFQVVILFRYVLDGLDEDFYESNAQSEAFNHLLALYGSPIPGGIMLTHIGTTCYGDDMGRYIIESRHNTPLGGQICI